MLAFDAYNQDGTCSMKLHNVTKYKSISVLHMMEKPYIGPFTRTPVFKPRVPGLNWLRKSEKIK